MNWLHMGLGIVVSALHASVKNPDSLKKEKSVLLEIRDLINGLFPGE